MFSLSNGCKSTLLLYNPSLKRKPNVKRNFCKIVPLVKKCIDDLERCVYQWYPWITRRLTLINLFIHRLSYNIQVFCCSQGWSLLPRHCLYAGHLLIYPGPPRWWALYVIAVSQDIILQSTYVTPWSTSVSWWQQKSYCKSSIWFVYCLSFFYVLPKY